MYSSDKRLLGTSKSNRQTNCSRHSTGTSPPPKSCVHPSRSRPRRTTATSFRSTATCSRCTSRSNQTRSHHPRGAFEVYLPYTPHRAHDPRGHQPSVPDPDRRPVAAVCDRVSGGRASVAQAAHARQGDERAPRAHQVRVRARPAHPPAQPHPLSQPRGGCDRGRPPHRRAGRPAADRPRSVQGDQRHARPPLRRPAAPGDRTAAGEDPAPVGHCSHASAATSSESCCPRSPTRRRRWWWPAALTRCWSSRSPSRV